MVCVCQVQNANTTDKAPSVVRNAQKISIRTSKTQKHHSSSRSSLPPPFGNPAGF